MNQEKQQALQALKTARGQIDGIIKMIEDGRYCIDISNQILASSAMLKRANLLILKQHMNHCVLKPPSTVTAVRKLTRSSVFCPKSWTSKRSLKWSNIM